MTRKKRFLNVNKNFYLHLKLNMMKLIFINHKFKTFKILYIIKIFETNILYIFFLNAANFQHYFLNKLKH